MMLAAHGVAGKAGGVFARRAAPVRGGGVPGRSRAHLTTCASAQKLAVVTGANTGMGKYTAEVLASKGYEVVMACRDEGKGSLAAREVGEATGGSVRFTPLDLGDAASVAACAGALVAEGRPVDVLVNNAGIMACPPWTTADGFEAQMGTNHLGHFALTLRLLPLLEAAGSEAGRARVVNVASAAHKGCAELDVAKLGSLDKEAYVPWGAYGASKAANILFTRELARRLEAAGVPVTANALCPGLVATDLGRYLVEAAPWWQKPITSLIIPVMMARAKGIPDGASTALHLALAPELEGVTGGYFVDSAPFESSDLAQDMDLAARLFTKSEELTGVSWPST